MKIEEAKRLIQKEWLSWPEYRDDAPWEDKFRFFVWMESNRPELLRFSIRGGDKWQRVKGWI